MTKMVIEVQPCKFPDNAKNDLANRYGFDIARNEPMFKADVQLARLIRGQPLVLWQRGESPSSPFLVGAALLP